MATFDVVVVILNVAFFAFLFWPQDGNTASAGGAGRRYEEPSYRGDLDDDGGGDC